MHSREKSLYLTCLAIRYEFYFTVSIKILKLNSSLAGRGKTEERRDRKWEVYYVVIVYSLIHVQLFVTPWTVAHQTSLSMQFSRQEYWSEFPLPSPGDLPDPGIEPMSPTLAGKFFTTEPPGKPGTMCFIYANLLITFLHVYHEKNLPTGC